jgi:hypothetical protein
MKPSDLVDSARRRTGLDDFGEPAFGEGLALLCEALAAEARLNDLGRVIWKQRLLGYLVQRLRIEDWYRRHPEIDAQDIVAPIFVVGLPRTGTTALSNLLAQDPETRSLRVWESNEPTPPPEAARQHDDPRIAMATQALEMMRAVAPKLASMHEDAPTGPTENQDLLGLSFRTYHFEGMAAVPSYTRWWFHCDMAPAYRYHRRVLKLLQWRCPPTRWHLKSPPDAFALDAVVAAYPDARFVMTHRDPARVLPSVCSLISTVHELTGEPPDPVRLGATQVEAWTEGMRRALDFRRRAGERRFTDVHFADLTADPLGTLRRAYAALGLPLTEPAEGRMRTWIAANPRAKHGEHHYTLEEFGLAADSVRAAFRFYTERCGVALEG